MMVWLRPEYILAFVTSLYYSSQLANSKTYDKFWCSTEEGYHHLSCSDERALLTDIKISKVYRRTQMCEPDVHTDYLIHCQSQVDGSFCEGNKTCTIEISSRDYLQCDDKTYAPTYFFVKYTCTQIHTMCTDTLPIRNTLHGYIISPVYPHPMADDLKCSLTIEVDPSMFIELSPVEINLQDALKCRGEYIEIFGYDSSSNDNNADKSNNWKEYHTWCGADRSLHNPIPNARYLIPSNSLYMSLQTGVSRQPRYFKIRYKVVPSTARLQYNSDGIAYDSTIKDYKPSLIMLTTSIMSTKVSELLTNDSHVKKFNETWPLRSKKKGIIIGIVALVIALLITIIVGVLVFLIIRRRRSSSSLNAKKKPTSSTTGNTTSKATDKAPLLEKTNNTSSNTAKQKLVPERTVPASDANANRFKSNEPTGTRVGSTKSETSKPPLTAVDSGIYGVDFTEDTNTKAKLLPSSTPETSTAQINTISEKLEPSSTVIVNSSDEPPTVITTVTVAEVSNDTEKPISATKENEPNEATPINNTNENNHSPLIDVASNENEQATSTDDRGIDPETKRTSITKSPLVIQQSDNIETIVIPNDAPPSPSHHPIPFNPLHVILQKDANKYYTTEYI